MSMNDFSRRGADHARQAHQQAQRSHQQAHQSATKHARQPQDRINEQARSAGQRRSSRLRTRQRSAEYVTGAGPGWAGIDDGLAAPDDLDARLQRSTPASPLLSVGATTAMMVSLLVAVVLLFAGLYHVQAGDRELTKAKNSPGSQPVTVTTVLQAEAIGEPDFVPDHVSGRPGDTLTIHNQSDQPCQLTSDFGTLPKGHGPNPIPAGGAYSFKLSGKLLGSSTLSLSCQNTISGHLQVSVSVL
jgi:hypothetical protein